MKRILFGLVLAGVLVAQDAAPPPQIPKPEPPRQQRVFMLQYADARNVAGVLAVFGYGIKADRDLHVVAVSAPPEAMAALAGVEVFIVDALRDRPHPTHAHVDMALSWIETLKPARGVLTNMFGDLDYATLAARLPKGIEPAYDGMVIETGV